MGRPRSKAPEEGTTLARKQQRDRGGKGGERKRDREDDPRKRQRKKYCAFCRDQVKHIDYKETHLLRKYISDRGKIRARRVTGTCSQHQRDVAMAVKNAREMALLPFSQR